MKRMLALLIIPLFFASVGGCQLANPDSTVQQAGTIIFRAEVGNGVARGEDHVLFDTGYQTIWFGSAHEFQLKRAIRAEGFEGMAAIYFEIIDREAKEFSDFTESIIDSKMAIEIDGRIVGAPVVNDRLPGKGIFMGGREGMTEAELERYLFVLNGNHQK